MNKTTHIPTFFQKRMLQQAPKIYPRLGNLLLAYFSRQPTVENCASFHSQLLPVCSYSTLSDGG